MEIICLGHASFRIKSSQGIIVTDPFDSDLVGMKFPKTTAHIVTISHDHKDHNNSEAVGQQGDEPKIVLSGAGEYESRGIEIVGIASFHDRQNGKDRGLNTIYRFQIGKMALVHLGDLGQKLTDEQLDVMDGVDVLFIPVGGVYTLDAPTACEIVNQLEPLIVIPMHYHRPQLNQQTFGKLSPVSAFLKEMGKDKLLMQRQLIIKEDQLPEEMQIVVLE